MTVLNLYDPVVAAKFSIQSPWDFFFCLDRKLPGLEGIYKIRIVLCHYKSCNDLLQFQRILWIHDQCHLKVSFIHIDILPGKILKSTYRSGICYHSDDKIIFHLKFI